ANEAEEYNAATIATVKICVDVKKEFNFFIVKHLFLSLFYLARFLVNALLRGLRATLTPISSK
ncbi:MAG: hypothetical protein VXW99_13230, partial [Pseudomonadota bacterium]|nr:hypothetical protein [Pseudomonadota bacterium]